MTSLFDVGGPQKRIKWPTPFWLCLWRQWLPRVSRGGGGFPLDSPSQFLRRNAITTCHFWLLTGVKLPLTKFRLNTRTHARTRACIYTRKVRLPLIPLFTERWIVAEMTDQEEVLVGQHLAPRVFGLHTYPYYIRIIFALYSYLRCIRIVSVLIRIVSALRPRYIRIVFALYPRCIHIVSVLYPICIHIIPMSFK